MAKTKVVSGHPFITYSKTTYDEAETVRRATDFYHHLEARRTVRDFSARPVPREVIGQLLRAASTAPSGAHKQPWTFCAVSAPHLKKAIREAAEQEEWESYNGRMPADWLEDLAPLQTDWKKEFLETAPWLIVVFKKNYEPGQDGRRRNTYYAVESCGLACGFLLAAIHEAGLAALTHTPSPMNFLAGLLQRPAHEKPFLLIPVGYPADECWVPDLKRKPLEEVAVWYE